MNWFRNPFTDQHVNDCLFVLRELGKTSGDEFAWRDVELKASTVIRKNSDLIKSKILSEREPAKNVVLTLVANLALNEAGSGCHHTYRGRLSMNGSSYRSIFQKIIGTQAECGFISPEEKRQAMQNIAEAIRDAG